MTRQQDRLGLYVALMFVAFAIAICISALFGAPSKHVGGNHEAPRVTLGPVAGSAGSRTAFRFGTDAGRRFDPVRYATQQASKFVEGRLSEESGAKPLSLDDASVLPPARSCGARASANRGLGAGRHVVRPTGGFPFLFGGVMPEELGPIPWRVWLKSAPSKLRTVTEVTRREAMLKGAQMFGASARLFDVDCEVERT
jgi:hypothetical protein